MRKFKKLELLRYSPHLQNAINAVIAERVNQLELFGDQSSLPLELWPSIMGEEFGEFCEAVTETCAENGRHPERGGIRNIYREACQIAAVAVQVMEILLPRLGAGGPSNV